jgi:hypothetical protein
LGSEIRVPKKPIPDLGSLSQGSKGLRIPDPNPQHETLYDYYICRLGINSYWVLRLPYVYWGEGGAHLPPPVPPTLDSPAGFLLKGGNRSWEIWVLENVFVRSDFILKKKDDDSMSTNNSVKTSTGRFYVLLILENVLVMYKYLRMKSWIQIHGTKIMDPTVFGAGFW